ncbi:MAG: bifunctional phosphopantothenoylcysteine decarboxylase/phosphopantothenate--cysteine ligase CoaBC [candidate division KSB1 bacterium]|nr:bifunctional phosphopantothenoylcysteine decarboxylase/phosphopantothenate--cysteine ligase CoaBC [candidate division KSB1 bacterium]
MLFQGRKVLVGVTGGIAAYKSCELVRALKREGAEVRVVMTKAACQFVTPLTFETLSENTVLTELFPAAGKGGTIHIEAARWPEVVVIAPATANCVAKVAAGVADDLLTTMVAATTAPVIFCPAMNKEMYAKAVFRQNVEQLKRLGYLFVDAEAGELACGEEGWGRLADKERILDAVKSVLLGSKELAGHRIVVTAGRTEEDIDPVRFVTNRSSGKMGFALAEVAALMGAEVHLITGPSAERPFSSVTCESVRTSAQMAEAVRAAIAEADVLIMAAAVADFRPKHVSPHKLKKGLERVALELERTEDILASIGRHKERRLLVGFAVETENELENATAKLSAKNLDMIVLNNPMEEGAGFGTDTNKVTLIKRDGTVLRLPLMTKREVARVILGHVVELLAKRGDASSL